MTGRERVIAALEHREGDRCPIYLWVFGQPGVTEDINARFGDWETFADHLELDMIQAFPAGGPLSGVPRTGSPGVDHDPTFGTVWSMADAAELTLASADDEAIYAPLQRAVEHDQGRRGRAVFVQTPGVFECANGFVGLQNQLIAALLEPELCRRLYDKIAAWSCRYIEHCAAIGVDVIHVSDDWGMQDRLLFPPDFWQEVIRPATARITAQAKACGLWCSLHSDGDITSVLDGVVDLGFNICHPVQESAGMDALAIKRQYAGRLALYGGLDVQSVLGRGDRDRVVSEVRRVMRNLKPGGGYIFCTSHMVQPGTPLDEVLLAYEVARQEAVY
ncbi:MAG: hypothetical protein IT204_20970 [Fimbriimonadaceae bacterium]|nr:hypothetical protein [Fimbriimonadaceae bacterium]